MKKRTLIICGLFVLVALGGYAKTTASHSQKSQTSAVQTVYVNYVVKSGDNLSSIAKKYNTSVASIQYANRLSTGNIKAGMKLVIPTLQKVTTPVAKTTYTAPSTRSAMQTQSQIQSSKLSYVVKSGDTLTSIAKKYQTTPQAIRKASGMRTSRLKIGMKLTVPTQLANTTTSTVVATSSAAQRNAKVVKNSNTVTVTQVGTAPAIKVGPCQSWLLISTQGQFIAGKNINKVWPMASITKMMTAYVALQAIQQGKFSLNSMYTVPWQATSRTVGGSSAFLYERETISLYDLLEGAIMPSGNDAATAIALMISGGNQNAFVAQMNATAKSLGMTHTRFYTPCGLPPSMTGGKGMDISTAADMAILATRLYNSSTYIQISSQKYAMIDGGRYQIRNSNQWLLTRVPGINGMKTGNHDLAKYNIVASVQRGNVGFIVLVFGCPTVEWLHVNPQKIINQAYQYYTQYGKIN
ncbi:MAG: LysM peptidoglycan-binding domain-containing protein [Fusobacteria bacterium]|nr:LysM peptidoglycan-binding domain-containing protein [Fusobacteriota bacterium]